MVGTQGHNIQADIYEAIKEWEEANAQSVKIILNGNNSKTEHYSALRAEVQVRCEALAKLSCDIRVD